MPVAPGWPEFWAQISLSGGLIALALVDIILKFAPAAWKNTIDGIKPLIAIVASYIVPLAVTAILGKFPTVDPLLWSAVYFLGSYAIHELLYRFIQKPVAVYLSQR
jgi:hypothetical protein